MKKEIQTANDHLAQLTDDARELLAATADLAGEKVEQVRTRLAATLDQHRDKLGGLRHQVVTGARALNNTVRTHPYETMWIALGVGAAVIGYLVARQRSSGSE